MTGMNPWISRPLDNVTADVVPEISGAASLLGPTAPQHGVPAPAEVDRLATVYPNFYSPLWVVGAHGGAGATSVAAMIQGAYPLARSWPHVAGHLVPVILVARSNMAGLDAAQRAAQHWASGLVPGVDLLGLVVLSDAPGKLPKVLRDRLKVIAGGFARNWFVPWIESWRLGEEITPATVPREARRLVDELTALITR